MSPSLREGETRTGTTGFSTPSPIRCSADGFTVVSPHPSDHGQMPPWKARAVPGQDLGNPRTPSGGATTKNGVGRLPCEEAADAVVKEKGLRPW